MSCCTTSLRAGIPKQLGLALAFLFPIPAASTAAAWDYGTQVRSAQRPTFAWPGCDVVFEDWPETVGAGVSLAALSLVSELQASVC